MFKCVIVEDEPLAMDRIKSYLSKLDFLHLEACFDNGVDALVYLHGKEIDIIFLDISIGEISGIKLLETLHPNAKVIIITAYDEYALKGYGP